MCVLLLNRVPFSLVVQNLSGEATVLHQLSDAQEKAEAGPVSNHSHLQDQQGQLPRACGYHSD